ncbi:MAG TPA: PfkB family carbohydrate kinase [Gaiellaceae bacterium]|nr:PfkB family carbohydrate kinase [Gaiellaceae bacterium]
MAVLCVGLATRDTIVTVPSHPQPDGRVIADELTIAGGGPAATAAVTLARLGVETAFAGAVGDDDAGDFVRGGLAAEGVDVSRLETVARARTAQSVILVGPGGARSIVHRPGTATVPDVDGAGFDWVHVDHEGFGHAHGRLSVDGGNPIPKLDLRGVAVYAPTAERLAADFGDAGAALAAGAEVVVVTRGDRGASAATRDGTFEAPGVPCEPVSTLGAGDVFHGALLAWLMRGAGLADALHAANTAASLSCRALDGRSAIPTLEELERSL